MLRYKQQHQQKYMTAEVLAKAAVLQASGQWQHAIDLLTESNRQQPDPVIEQCLVDARVRAFENTAWPENPAPWPPVVEDPFGDMRGIPEVSRNALDLRNLAGGVLHHGALLVRGLVPPAQVALLISDIDRAVDLRNARAAGPRTVITNDPWLAQSEYLAAHHKLGVGRKFIADTGGVWAVDSPRSMFHVLELYEQLGLRELLTDYFGEAPCLSVRKWVLRRVSPIVGESDWHQDGAFMGAGVRSMNLWIALSHCGGDTDTPGIDVVPKRLDSIVPTGSHGARFDWTVGHGLVEEQFRDTPPVRPLFAPGDALFFDHFNLHRTTYLPTMVRDRYAIESWFFAASLNPANQIPLVF